MLPNLIEELVDVGLTEAQIAELVESTQPTINRIRKGRIKDPKHSLAKALEQLHAQRCPAERAA